MSRNYSKSTVESLIKKLDEKLTEKVEVVAIGGTALSLIGERLYSKDIDLCYINCASPIEFCKNVVDSGKEVGIESEDIEMFNGFEMSLLELPQFNTRAPIYEPLSLKHIIFKTMHPVDIFLSKIYRGNPRDIEDAERLIRDGIIKMSDIQPRFMQLIRCQKDFKVRKEFHEKYRDFMQGFKSK